MTDLPKGEHRILTAVAQYPDGVTHEQIAVLTGYKTTSRRTYLQRLAEKGLIERTTVGVKATPSGVTALGSDFEPLPMGDELREYWRDKLPLGESRILDVLITAYPAAVEHGELEEQTGYKTTSRRTYLQRLRARQLVTTDGSGGAQASEVLFD